MKTRPAQLCAFIFLPHMASLLSVLARNFLDSPEHFGPSQCAIGNTGPASSFRGHRRLPTITLPFILVPRSYHKCSSYAPARFQSVMHPMHRGTWKRTKLSIFKQIVHVGLDAKGIVLLEFVCVANSRERFRIGYHSRQRYISKQ